MASRPRRREVHVICDNVSSHKTELGETFLAKHPRVHIHYTPTYSSWLQDHQGSCAPAPEARDFTNRRVRKPDGEDQGERSRNRTKSRKRARVEHPFLVLKRLRGFAKVRYRGLAKNANRAFTALAMVNLYLAARRLPALVRS